MITPTHTSSADIYIHVARGTAWQKFIQISDWPRWNAAILTADWLTGNSWQEGARFQWRQQNRFGTTSTAAIIRMVVPSDTTVWESESSLPMVQSAHFTDTLGGCTMQLRYTGHGLAVFTNYLAQGSIQRRLEQNLRAFKEYVERK
ncbi:MAG: hypothetical protein NT075_13300 [Chloroflexi bacterium]|nr:hypothetical protein [Chloroflexota bacterium]